MAGFEINTGRTGFRKFIVTADKLATAYGSDTVEVLATPALISMMEQTAMESIQPLLPSGSATVGSEVNIRHLKPTLQGREIEIMSRLIAVENRKLVFEVKAMNENKLIGEGIHVRYIIDIQKFTNSLNNF